MHRAQLWTLRHGLALTASDATEVGLKYCKNNHSNEWREYALTKPQFFISSTNFNFLLERNRSASAPGVGALSERRSERLARSAVGAPLRVAAPERTWSGAPGECRSANALQYGHNSLRS